MLEALKHILTAKDGATYAPSRVYWMLAALTQIVLTAYGVVAQGHEFSSTDFGTGMAAILAAGAAGVWITRKSDED